MLLRRRSNITLSVRDSGLCSLKAKTPLKGRGFLYKIDEVEICDDSDEGDEFVAYGIDDDDELEE